MMLPDELLREFKELRREVNKIKLFDIPKKSDLGGGGGGYTPPNYDLDYLRLDASNDPITADLDINGVVVGRGNGNDPESTVVGANALINNASGFCNTAIGTYALQSNMAGTHNTAVGLAALLSDIGGANVAIGSGALDFKASGDENTAIGFRAGQTLADGISGITSANQSIYIGARSKGAQVSAHLNEIVIGTDAIGLGDNTVVLGNASITQTVLRGILTTDTQAVHKVFIGPVSGADAAPTFRVLDVTDIPAHVLLGATHSDTLTGSVLDGSIIIGNVTPKWSALAISIPSANVRNVLGIDNGETRPSWKAALDATNPATLTAAGAAAAGTSLVFSHRDHLHQITSSSNPGAAASLLASTAAGLLTLVGLTTTAVASLTTPAESWIGPSSTTGIYFKGGYVGIGVTPAYQLDILPNAPNYPSIVARMGRNTINGDWGSYNLSGSDGTPLGNMKLIRNATTSGFDLAFENTSFGGSPIEKVRFVHGGNVGIGTIAPGASLDIHNSSDKIGLQVQGFSTQTNNLQEWLSSVPAILSHINGNGTLDIGIATGTAPLVIASTTAVTNLNSDLLDGQHGSYYQAAGAIYNSAANQATVNGLTGTAVWSQPFQGASYKKFIVYLTNFTSAGTVITFTTVFVKAPYVYGDAAAVAIAVTTTTTVTLTSVGAVAGFIIIEGY